MLRQSLTERNLIRFSNAVALAACFLATLSIPSPQAISQDDANADALASATAEAKVNGLRAHALMSLHRGDTKAAIKAADAMVRLSPDDPRTTREAANIYLRSGKSKWALRLFDRYLETNGEEMPYLWQRGIALYFMRDFKTGVEQFEEHRKVNPNDVENAAWHFLCLAKLRSPEEAKKNVLAAPNDPRIPMEEIRNLLITGDRDSVRNRIAQTPADSQARKAATFYGNFYLGLYADALGESKEAQALMKKAAENAPRDYMGDVARVYAQWLSDDDE